MEKGLVFDIHRGTTHDGPGMRTTVFLKGCPLRCRWCQNPESINPNRELQWDVKKCIGCRLCVNSCPAEALSAGEDGIKIDHKKCKLCFQCTEKCPSKAISPVGEYWDTDLLVKEACKDNMFFDAFSGGITVSGGEPLLQYKFLEGFLKELKMQGINTAVDTCGFGKREAYEKIYPYVDTFLYDIKFIDENDHLKYTGVSNRVILGNLKYIADRIRRQKDTKLWIRTPLIPQATATKKNLAEIGDFVQKELADVIERWELCAFNNICREKYTKIGRTWEYAKSELMTDDDIQGLVDVIGKNVRELLVISGLTKKD